MSTMKPKPGTIGWIDLTVPDAESIRDFYKAVVGWESAGVDMGGYEDFNMQPSDGGGPVAGICHARGQNADLPAAWMIYLVVEDLDRSITACRERGGEIITGPKGSAETGRYAAMRDPAGAVSMVYQPAQARASATKTASP